MQVVIYTYRTMKTSDGSIINPGNTSRIHYLDTTKPLVMKHVVGGWNRRKAIREAGIRYELTGIVYQGSTKGAPADALSHAREGA